MENGDGVTEFSVTFLDSIIYVVEEVNGVKLEKSYNNSSKLSNISSKIPL